MKQTQSIRITSHDTDANGFARASVILRYIEEQAMIAHREWGPSIDELRSRGLAFVVSRLSLSLYLPVFENDRLTAASWSCGGRGCSFMRCGDLRRGDEIVAEMSSVWALVEFSTGRLLRYGDITLGFEDDPPLIPGGPPRFVIPVDFQAEDVGSHTAVYSECDRNGHINNTNYLDILCDSLPGLPENRVTQIDIRYITETRRGEKFHMLRRKNGDVCLFRTVLEGGAVGIEARICTDESQPQDG